MTLPPDFGPTGRSPETEIVDLDLDMDPDYSQPATQGMRQADFTQPVSQDWLNQTGGGPAMGSAPLMTATAVPPLSFDDDDEPERDRGVGGVVAALAIGALVAVAMGAYGKMHAPTGEALNIAGFSSGVAAKAWLGTVAFVLAVVQVLSAMAMWGRLPGWTAGHGTAVMHRWSGRLAVLASLPVAAHCLYALGFQDFDTRVLLHSLFGCFFYGLFVCKMIVLTRHRTPGWVLPVVGASVFTGLVGLWVTSSLWFFSEYGVSF
jgi:hypothetical protein